MAGSRGFDTGNYLVAMAARVRSWVDAVEAQVVSTARTREVVDRH